MDKLLSIVIPTYNRAAGLDRQLEWLAQEIQGYEQDCEIFISDNCSTDETAEVIQKWQSAFNQITCRLNRNDKNILCIPNVELCLNAARGQFVWTVGDHDPVKPGTLAIVLRYLKQNPDLTLLYLNFYGRDEKTGEKVGVGGIESGNWFDSDFAARCSDGRKIFEHSLNVDFGAIIFLTATIYRTQYVQESTRLWPGAVNNWGGQGFWTGYCATKGKVMITHEPYLECMLGSSYWLQERGIWLKVIHHEIPEVLLQLQEKAGYSKAACRAMLLHHYRKNNINKVNHIDHLKAFRRWPLFVLRSWITLLSPPKSSAQDDDRVYAIPE
jgi:glycosyltransferase involved in cell wall biosynthesis